MTNQTFDFEAITDDEAGKAFAEVLDEELEVAAGGAVWLSKWMPDRLERKY